MSNLNSKKISYELLASFKPVLVKFKQRYAPALFGYNEYNKEILYEICEKYISEFQDAGITEGDVNTYGLESIDSEKFGKYPPNPHELSIEIQRIKKQKQESEISHDERLVTLFDWMLRRYPNLWVKEGQKKDVIADWEGCLKEHDCESYDVSKVISLIRNQSEYAKYPPSNAEIERFLRISSCTQEIPTPNEAYLQIVKSTNIEELPLLLRYTRRLFGSHALRIRTDLMVKRDFIALYNSVVDDFLAGNIDLEASFNHKRKPEDGGPKDINRISKEKLSELIAGM